VRISRDTDSAAAAFAENIGSYPNYDAIMVTDEEPEGGEPWAMKKVGNVTYVRVNAKVAEAAGFSHSHVHAIFKARRRTLSQVISVASTFDCSVRDIVRYAVTDGKCG
jgi:hypothetical protein